MLRHITFSFGVSESIEDLGCNTSFNPEFLVEFKIQKNLNVLDNEIDIRIYRLKSINSINR